MAHLHDIYMARVECGIAEFLSQFEVVARAMGGRSKQQPPERL